MALPAIIGALGSLGGLSQTAALVSGLGKTVAAVEGLKVVFSAVGEKMAESLKDITKVDQRLSVINLELQDVLQGNIGALEDTTGGLTNATKALTELRVKGFNRNNKNLVDLATRLKLSGQNTEALFKISQSLLGVGGATESAIDQFARNVTDLAIRFETTGDSIVSAVSKLSKNLADLRVTGGVENVTNITAQLAASLGPELADQVGSFLSQLTSASADLNQVARLGIEDLLDQLISGAKISDPTAFIAELLDTANRSTRAMVGETGEITQRQFKAVRGFVGDLGITSIGLNEAFTKALESANSQKEGSDKISELIAVFKENVMAPFNQAVVRLQPSFERMIKSLSFFGASILNIVGAFAPVIALIFNIVTAVAGIFGMVVNLIASVIQPILSTIGSLFGFDSNPVDDFKSYSKVFETIAGTGTNNLNRTEDIKQSSMSIVNINKNQSEILESMRATMAGDSQNLDKIGMASEASERRALLEKIRETSDISEITRQNLNVVDRLSRSVELQGIADLVATSSESLEYQRRIADHTRKGIPGPQIPGAAKK